MPVDLTTVAEHIREGEPEGVYGFVLTHFLPCVIGNMNWRVNVTEKRLNAFTNFTDEVLMVFLLENSINVWNAVYHNKSVTEESAAERLDVPSPLYTEFMGRTARKYSG